MSEKDHASDDDRRRTATLNRDADDEAPRPFAGITKGNFRIGRRGVGRPGRLGLVAMITLVGLVLVGGCMTESVGSGERGVKFSRFTGTVLNDGYGEGLHVFLPWERMIVYEVREMTADEQITALSSNGLAIGMHVSVRYRPEPSELPRLHVALGPDYYNRLIQPEVRSAAREVVGRFTPEELYSTRRTELQERIERTVAEAVRGEHVDVEAILIRDVDLPEQIQRAIQTKLQEEQRVQQIEFTIALAQREAERKRIEAEGQAAYQRIITESLNPQFLRYEGIQATRALAESPNAKVVVIGQGADGLPIILGE